MTVKISQGLISYYFLVKKQPFYYSLNTIILNETWEFKQKKNRI